MMDQNTFHSKKNKLYYKEKECKDGSLLAWLLMGPLVGRYEPGA
jgi:hypothetical protein